MPRAPPGRPVTLCSNSRRSAARQRGLYGEPGRGQARLYFSCENSVLLAKVAELAVRAATMSAPVLPSACAAGWGRGWVCVAAVQRTHRLQGCPARPRCPAAGRGRQGGRATAPSCPVRQQGKDTAPAVPSPASRIHPGGPGCCPAAGSPSWPQCPLQTGPGGQTPRPPARRWCGC